MTAPNQEEPVSARSYRLNAALVAARMVALGLVIQLAPTRHAGTHEIEARAASAADLG
jgi:hypothetical protein